MCTLKIKIFIFEMVSLEMIFLICSSSQKRNGRGFLGLKPTNQQLAEVPFAPKALINPFFELQKIKRKT